MPRAETALKWRPTFYLSTIRRNNEMSVPTGWYKHRESDCLQWIGSEPMTHQMAEGEKRTEVTQPEAPRYPKSGASLSDSARAESMP